MQYSHRSVLGHISMPKVNITWNTENGDGVHILRSAYTHKHTQYMYHTLNFAYPNNILCKMGILHMQYI